MQYLWTNRLILLLGFISFSGLLFDLWSNSALTMMFAAISGKVAKNIIYFWQPEIIQVLVWLIGCYVGFKRSLYDLPILFLFMTWLHGQDLVKLWQALISNIPSSNLFQFLAVPYALLTISITTFFLISILCLTSWYFEAKKLRTHVKP